MSEVTNESEKGSHFIRQIIVKDLEQGKKQGKSVVVQTRFPPEPNGYLHIGHAKSICLNFGMAEQFQGHCNLRFDDTNPEKESQDYIESIIEDIRWLGFKWQNNVKYASDYFDQLYQFALALIKAGKAYVCSLPAEDIRTYRGTLTEAGRVSPYRNRTVEENLALFEAMRQGQYQEAEHVLRAKIDMAAGNINLRDPVLYRIRYAQHHQTGNKWCVYPMYDYTHCVSDALEGITHSLCTLEFEDHRPLYDWILDQLDVPCHPQQIEFARLNLNYTVTSKRKLKQLVDEGVVQSWDDPRMPTISGMRRRGYSAASIRNFCHAIGVAKANSVVDMEMLEFAVRDDLDKSALRVMCVLNPIKLVITNYPEGQQEWLKAPCHPKLDLGYRQIPFMREVYIEADDFSEQPPPKYFRLAPGKEVRLRYGYVVRCEAVIKDETSGQVTEIHCTYDADTLGKKPQGRKVKGVIHWVPVDQALPCQVRLYDRLFLEAEPTQLDCDNPRSFLEKLNPESLRVLLCSYIEPYVRQVKPETCFQFERLGYFCADRWDCRPDNLVFNRTVSLRDGWAKVKG